MWEVLWWNPGSPMCHHPHQPSPICIWPCQVSPCGNELQSTSLCKTFIDHLVSTSLTYNAGTQRQVTLRKRLAKSNYWTQFNFVNNVREQLCIRMVNPFQWANQKNKDCWIFENLYDYCESNRKDATTAKLEQDGELPVKILWEISTMWLWPNVLTRYLSAPRFRECWIGAIEGKVYKENVGCVSLASIWIWIMVFDTSPVSRYWPQIRRQG